MTDKPLKDWTLGEVCDNCKRVMADNEEDDCTGCVFAETGRGLPDCVLIDAMPDAWDNRLARLGSPRVEGVAPDAPITTNAQGGKQSDTPYAFHMLPIGAVFAAAQVAAYGAAKYGETFDSRNYTKIPAQEHINHCIQHLYAYLAGDTQDDHLAHAIVRAMFAYETAEREHGEED